MGFLKEESLYIILHAFKDHRIHNNLHFRQENIQIISMNKSGLLAKFLIAAKYDHTIPSGWPALQIRRRVNLSYHVVQISTMKEPRPTGYLNVFEYDMLSEAFEIQLGDAVRVYWLHFWTNRTRYSLAYVGNYKMMVSVKLHQNQSVITRSNVTLNVNSNSTSGSRPLQTFSTIGNNDPTELVAATKEPSPPLLLMEQSKVATAIVGGVLGAMVVLLSVLTTTAGIIALVIYRRKTPLEIIITDAAGVNVTQHNIMVDANQAYMYTTDNNTPTHTEAIHVEDHRTPDTYTMLSSEVDENQARPHTPSTDLEVDETENTDACPVEGTEAHTNQAYVSTTFPTIQNAAYNIFQDPPQHDYDYVVL